MRQVLIGTAATMAVVAGAVSAGEPPVRPRPVAAQPDGRLVVPPPKAGRIRPLVAIVAENEGAETTDFAIPYGVLKEAGVAEVRAVSMGPGPVQLMMALKVKADQTAAEFDASEPAGADIVIVPAQRKPKDPALAAWVAEQARKGAVVVSICEGARVLANARLLDGRRATTHWFALNGLEKAYPQTTWVRDRRYVQDGPIISTTGVSASLPASLALVEAIGGRPAAEATARRLGVADWSAAHRTADFQLSRHEFAHALISILAFWTHETVEAPITDGEDEIALALQSDAWSRSFRTRVVTTREGLTPVRSRRGLVILPDAAPRSGRHVIPTRTGPPARALDEAIAGVTRRYGPVAGRLAQLGMEYIPPRAAPIGAAVRAPGRFPGRANPVSP